MVAAKNISFNLLLSTNTSQSLSRMRSRNEETHSDLMSKAAEHRAVLQKAQEGITQVEEKVSRAGAAYDHRLDDIENNMSQARETSHRPFDQIGARVEDTQTSVMSLRSTGEQILKCLGTFPREMLELLQNITRASWQMYQVLLMIQQTTVRSPTGLLESNIRFEDALRDHKEFLYEYFRHWEPFEGFLRAQFKYKPGERKVLEGRYHIIDVGIGRSIVKKEHWARKKCSLKFYPILNELEDSSSRFEEEGEVARRRNEEDLHLYGSRSKPMDALELDLAEKKKRIEENRSHSMPIDDEDLLEDFLESAESLWRRLKKLLKACEDYTWKRPKEDGKVKLGKGSGREFVDTLFGFNRELEATQTLIPAMRLWIVRFDASCVDILHAAMPRAKRI
ncbi:MAG: hypothetical protein Q9175_000481 [Cornicularia normoerica]